MCLLLLRWNSIESRARPHVIHAPMSVYECFFLTAQSYLTSIQKTKCSSGRWRGGWCNTWTSADGADGDVGEHGLALLPLQRGGGGGGPAQDPPGQARQAKEAAHRGAEGARHAAGRSPSFSSSLRKSLQDDDPCLVSTMTESLLPFLPGGVFISVLSIWFPFERNFEQWYSLERGSAGAKQQSSQQQGTQVTFLVDLSYEKEWPAPSEQVVSSCVQVIKLMSISHGDRSVDLPSLNVEHNYPHLLSELVMKL